MELKTVTVSKKQSNFLKNNNLEYILFDFKTQDLPCEKISSWLEKTEIKTLFNARSTTFRNLKLKELNLEPKAQEEWLCKENLLIKRPVIEYDGKLIVGFNEENYQKSFL